MFITNHCIYMYEEWRSVREHWRTLEILSEREMVEMLGVLEGLTDAGGGGGGGEQTGGAADQTPQIDQAELEEQVNDLGKLGLFVIWSALDL